jgi:hypothetical protein
VGEFAGKFEQVLDLVEEFRTYPVIGTHILSNFTFSPFYGNLTMPKSNFKDLFDK